MLGYEVYGGSWSNLLKFWEDDREGEEELREWGEKLEGAKSGSLSKAEK